VRAVLCVGKLQGAIELTQRHLVHDRTMTRNEVVVLLALHRGVRINAHYNGEIDERAPAPQQHE